MLKYLEPAPPMSGEEPKLITTTISEYDNSQLKAAFKGVLMGVGMMAVMHIYFKYTNPLLIQSTFLFPKHAYNVHKNIPLPRHRANIPPGIIPVKSAIESKLVQVHILGKPAIGDLKRPWKAAGFMQGLSTGAAEPSSDKKSIEEAEKSGRGGVKEE
jgi:hypothetical protein